MRRAFDKRPCGKRAAFRHRLQEAPMTAGISNKRRFGRLTAAPTDVPGRSGILCRLTRKNRREGSPLSGGFALHCYFTVSFTALEVTLPAALVTVQRYLYPFFVFFAVKE